MASAPQISPAPQLLGTHFLAFRHVAATLHGVFDAHLERFLQDVHYNAWYPVTVMQHLCQRLAAYANAGLIFEQIGVELAQIISGYDEWQPFFRTGGDFLHAHGQSQLYYHFVSGPADQIGALSLVQVNDQEGRAVVHSTTPFNRDLERGLLLGGLRLSNSFDYVTVDNSADANTFQMRFVTAEHAVPGTSTPITAQEFLTASRVSASHHLTGSALHTVFWRYKAQVEELARQQRLRLMGSKIVSKERHR
jgi:hypothetical protein